MKRAVPLAFLTLMAGSALLRCTSADSPRTVQPYVAQDAASAVAQDGAIDASDEVVADATSEPCARPCIVERSVPERRCAERVEGLCRCIELGTADEECVADDQGHTYRAHDSTMPIGTHRCTAQEAALWFTEPCSDGGAADADAALTDAAPDARD